MGFFKKLKEGLSKTKGAFVNQMNEVVKSFRRVDEDLLEELEEVMIMADMGAATAEAVTEELRDRIKTENIKDPEQVREALIGILAEQIGEGEPLRLSTKPSVILVIGVNGVGKTTSIGKIANNLRKEGKKVIVFARFVPEIDAIARMLRKKNIGYALIKGDVKDRAEQVSAFQTDPSA